jgi:predicted heme/steroid binding protein
MVIPDKFFSELELRIYNGEDHAHMYVAYKGIAYDVTNCPKWRSGLHELIHFPGQDLSNLSSG